MPSRRDRNLRRFLLEGEQVVVDQPQHWAAVAGPVLATAAGLFVVFWVDAHVRLDGGPFARLLWILWFVCLGWMIFEILEWRHDRFIATDKRLLLDHGLFTTKIAMMPLVKVTDMSYRRTVPGRILGYGDFILESAGQDQALRQVGWVRNSDETYRTICWYIFGGSGRPGDPTGVVPSGGPDRDAGADVAFDVTSGDAPGDRSSGGAGPLGDPSHTGARSAVREDESYSRAIPLHRRGVSSPIPSGEVIYSSDEERLRRRLADTGPIPPPRPNPRDAADADD